MAREPVATDVWHPDLAAVKLPEDLDDPVADGAVRADPAGRPANQPGSSASQVSRTRWLYPGARRLVIDSTAAIPSTSQPGPIAVPMRCVPTGSYRGRQNRGYFRG
jgi:hypothetical protein